MIYLDQKMKINSGRGVAALLYRRRCRTTYTNKGYCLLLNGEMAVCSVPCGDISCMVFVFK